MRESGGAWELRHGPFDDAELDALPDGGWTVLVQQVDQIEPPVEALRSRFVDFLPRWRLDDVMVSYAPPGGGVGAHVDNYDVFLVQGRGARRWEVEGAPRAAAAEALVPGQPVRVLERFEAAASELLAPGDALYLPPRWAHRGTSEHKQCMTYSVGFRAPSRAELVRHFADTVAARLPEDDRFSDPPEADGALAAGGARRPGGGRPRAGDASGDTRGGGSPTTTPSLPGRRRRSPRRRRRRRRQRRAWAARRTRARTTRARRRSCVRSPTATTTRRRCAILPTLCSRT